MRDIIPIYPIIHVEEISSTNEYFKLQANFDGVGEGAIVYADYQTKGRGQKGNVWESEKGKNLLFSMVLCPHILKINEQFIISQIVSLAIQEFLNTETGSVKIKWPNDIYWRDQKICGILIENILKEATIERSIIGVGLNINQIEFSGWIPNPVSLKMINGRNYDIKSVAEKIQTRILTYYHQLKKGNIEEIRKKYKANLYRSEGYYMYADAEGVFEARIKDVENNGVIVLETKEQTEKKYFFKEVKYI